MLKRIKRKQPALAAFGFTKKIKHRGEEIAIHMLLEAVETLFEWENCEKSFKSPQGLAFHAKVRQGIIPKEYCTSEPPVIQSAEELISLLVKYVVENLVNKVVNTRAKSEGASKVVKKCHQYSAAFKGKTINAYDKQQIKKVSQNRLVRLKANFQDGSKSGKPSSRMLHPLTESCISKERSQQNIWNCTKHSSRNF